MGIGFIIMQIGNEDLDKVYRDAFVPAMKACGLEPKRVDKHNQGDLLKSEIIAFIESADIIVADVTNERPNCYLEVGYAMGVDKFRNLILTAREDHSHDSSNYRKGGPKVHFDLSGYDVLFWDPAKLDELRARLEKRIKHRQTIVPVDTAESAWDDRWIGDRRSEALVGFEKGVGRAGHMEVAFALSAPKTSKNQHELLEAAKNAVIHTSGWPFALVLTKEEARPKVRAFGIFAEVFGELKDSYDYWALRSSGDFFLLRNLPESPSPDSVLRYDARVIQVTEALLYCARLYSRLGIEPTRAVSIRILHSGLKGRRLLGSGLLEREEHRTREGSTSHEIAIPLMKIESDLVGTVKRFTEPLFTLFDFFVLGDSTYEDLVNGFVSGRFG